MMELKESIELLQAYVKINQIVQMNRTEVDISLWEAIINVTEYASEKYFLESVYHKNDITKPE